MIENNSSANIIPQRIKEAREVRGFTLVEFAENLSITKQAVAQYETGQIKPSGSMFAQIIELTQLPSTYFTKQRNRTSHPEKTTFWRSLKKVETSNRIRVSRRLEWANDICEFIEEYIDLPDVNIPHFDIDYTTIDSEQIEDIADSIREHWGLGFGPITNLTPILEDNGIICISENVECEGMDALTRWQGGRPFILYSNEILSGPRTLFNLAHELGHVILHGGVEIDSTNLKKIEKQANRFAGAFLLPRRTFCQEIISTTLKYLILLKSRWGVSIGAIAYRCSDLNLMSTSQKGNLFRNLNIKNMRKIEPYDDEFQQSKPVLLKESIEILVENDIKSIHDFELEMSLHSLDIEGLAGLAVGYLNPIRISAKKRPELKIVR